MNRFKHLVAIFLAGTLALTSVPTNIVFADTSDILISEGEDILTPDTDEISSVIEDSDDILNDTAVSADAISADRAQAEDNEASDPADGSDEDVHGGYVEPEWVGIPITVDPDLTIEGVDDLIEGTETVIDEDGIIIYTDAADELGNDRASIEPVSEDATELPSAFPASYGTGSAAELAAIDTLLESRITPERNQSPYGSCWAHEAIALTEAYKINQQNVNPASIDNSERHLVYNTYSEGTNPIISDTGDSVDLNGATETTFLDRGGNAYGAAITLAKWRGVALEEEAPYSTIGGGTWSNNEFLSTGGRLENCYVINIKESPEMVKRFIREYGAVGISYYSPSGTTAETNNTVYNSDTNAFYCPIKNNTNHGVAIVGWDDNFSRENFASDPEADGAWLVRNSWKTGGTVEDKKYASYFWLSYKDESLADKAYAYKMQENNDLSDHNYFYDTQYHAAAVLAPDDGRRVEAANVFKASSTSDYETLDSVTIQSFADRTTNKVDDTSYTVKVYTNLTDPNKPDSGVLVAEKKGEFPFLGLYTVRFDNPVVLAKGTDFSVVVSVNGGWRSVDVETRYPQNPSATDSIYYAGSNEGQSFYRLIKDDIVYNWVDNKKGNNMGNFCISAQTSDYEAELHNVLIYSRTTDSEESIANLSISSPTGGGNVFYGDEVTVIAPDKTKDGYTFLGWCEATEITDGKVTRFDDTILSENLQFSFTVGGSINLVAVYMPSANASLTVKVKNGAQYKLGNNIYTASTRFTNTQLGMTYTITAVDPDKVLQWENESGKVIGRGESVKISMARDTIITLVYKDGTEGQAYLQFVSDCGQLLSYNYVSGINDISFPGKPTKFGYNFEKWVFEGSDIEATKEAIVGRIEADTMITVVPKYSKDATTYNVTVNYIKGTVDIHPQFVYNDVGGGTGLNITAPDIPGYTFAGWEDNERTDEKGEKLVLGYKPSYYLLVTRNTVLNACYVENDPEKTIIPLPTITIGDLYKTTSADGILKVCGTITRSIPEGYTLMEQGFLWTRGVSGFDKNNFNIENPNVNKYIGNTSYLNGYLSLSVSVPSDDTLVCLRGYMILKNNATGIIKLYDTEYKEGKYKSI